MKLTEPQALISPTVHKTESGTAPDVYTVYSDSGNGLTKLEYFTGQALSAIINKSTGLLPKEVAARSIAVGIATCRLLGDEEYLKSIGL